ncbi:hypothetical protein FV228_08925 [Methylobacterium sp. WL18]|nr:hypothetical protein FV228_08925 [Methylobacterium sp. WL18]
MKDLSIEDHLLTITEYNHRLKDKKYIRRRALSMFKSLEHLRDITEPERGEKSCEGKDFAAREALSLIGRFSELMGGWACDHAIGIAMEGQELLSAYTHTTRQSKTYNSARDLAEKHIHEITGRALSNRFHNPADYDPVIVRQTLLNIVESRSSILPEGMALVVVQALRALTYGEIMPVFMPETRKYAKKRWRELNAQLKVLEHIEFRINLGQTRISVMKMTDDLYGLQQNTLEGWKKNVKKGLGDLHYEARMQFAKEMAFSALNPLTTSGTTSFEAAEDEYGESALKRDVSVLHELGAQKKRSPSTRKATNDPQK